MAYATPRINSVDMPTPSEYAETTLYLGARAQLANGTYRTHLVNNSVKRTFTLRWNKLTDAEKAVVQTAFDTVLKNSVAFRTPYNETVSLVILDPSQTELSWEAYRIGNLTGANWALHWRTSLTLREV
jgi:hypothetical protein